MKKLILLAVVFCIMGMLQAHEFWLQPQKFKFNVGDKMTIDFMVGEGFEGEFWDLGRHKVERLEMHNRLGNADLLQHVKKTQGENLEYSFSSVGTHLLTMQSNAAYIELDAEKFNAYLEEDGLDYIVEQRKATGTQDQGSREFYTRYAKLMVQSGDRADDTYKKQIGFKLEIIPLQNPYDLHAGDYLECKVMYQREPAPHALVKVWSHIGNRTFLQNIYTENDGTIKFPISNTGRWMVSTVKMIEANRSDADWESLWASLVFGIE
jgi:uncharacterized GH25 family protein